MKYAFLIMLSTLAMLALSSAANFYGACRTADKFIADLQAEQLEWLSSYQHATARLTGQRNVSLTRAEVGDFAGFVAALDDLSYSGTIIHMELNGVYCYTRKLPLGLGLSMHGSTEL